MSDLGRQLADYELVSDFLDRLEDRLVLSRLPSDLQRKAKELPFWQWTSEARLWIDREPFTYEGFGYLESIYKSFPEKEEDFPYFESAVMKSSQTGGSVLFLLWDIYLLLRFNCNIGYYLPDQTTAFEFSDERYMKMIRSNPELLGMMQDAFGYHDEGRKILRRLGNSAIMFLWTGMNIGPGTNQITMRTEAMPMDALTFDEVQGMTRSQMERTEERLSASLLKIKTKVSTPRWPETDIHYEFLRGRQLYFHSNCNCLQGIPLHFEWPNCIGESNGRVFYRCPHCDTEIKDPQQGRYIAYNLKADFDSYHFAQTLSRRIRPQDLLKAYVESKDKQNFYNRKLGLPYVNESEVPITFELLKRKAFRNDISWSLRGAEVYMGIDHMGNLNVHVLKSRTAEGKERVIHLEWTEGDDPFERSGQLMEEYNVQYCALENLPNYNEAFRFAKEFPGRVFIVEYGAAALKGEMLRWQDRDKSEPQAVRKTADEARMQWGVTVDQFKFMSYSLGKIADGAVEIPDPDAKPLMRPRLVKGIMVPDNLSKLYCTHLTKIALKTEKEENETKYTTSVEKIGPEDPHFAFANMCCDVAIARAYGTTRLITQEIEDEEQVEGVQTLKPAGAFTEQIRRTFPMVGQTKKETCGACANFRPYADNPMKGRCHGDIYRNVETLASNVLCDDYQERET